MKKVMKNAVSKLSLAKKFLCFSLVFATVMTTNLTTALAASDSTTDQKPYTLYDLKEAGKYAVFARNCEIRCDMEGNIASMTAALNGVHIGLTSNVEGFKTSYVQSFRNLYWCSEFLKTSNCTDTFIIGNQYNITKNNEWLISENGRTLLKSPLSNVSKIVNMKDTSYTLDFEYIFDCLDYVSYNLMLQNTNGVTIKTGTNYNRNGSLVCNNKINVVNLTMAQYNSMYDFNIAMADDATVIINLVDYNGQNLDNKVTINGKRPSYKGLAGRVLWNFGTYNKTVSFGETTQGCILAPCAKVSINSTHNGNVIACAVTNPGGEIHKNDFVGMYPIIDCD